MGLFNYRPPRTTEPRELLLWYKNITNFVNNPSVEAGNIIGTLTGSQIGAGTISLDKFLAGLRPVQIVTSLPSLPSSTYPQGAVVFLTSDNKLYRSTGSSWTAVIPTTDLSGTITETQIADDSISTPKLKANIVTTAKLAAGAVTANELAANSVIAGKIEAGAIRASHLYVGAPGTALNADPYPTDLAAWLGGVHTPNFDTGITDGKTGSNALTGNGDSNHFASTEFIPIDIARTYRVSAYIKKNISGVDGFAFLGLQEYGATKNDLSTVLYYSPFSISGAALNLTYTKYSATILPSAFNAATKYVKMHIILGYQTTVGYMFAQDIRVEEMSPASLIVDGAIRTSKIYSGLYTPPGDNNSVPGAGMKLDVDSGKIEAYGDSHSFGGPLISSDGNYMVCIGRSLTPTGKAKRYPLFNSTNFTTDGKLNVYEWLTSSWVFIVHIGYNSVAGSYVYSESSVSKSPIYAKDKWSSGGIAILGDSDNGYGGLFVGGAQGGPISLYPSGSASAPSHNARAGTLWVTSEKVLYINTSATTEGTTWTKVGAQ